MINHARTLLLNTAPSQAALWTYPSAALVPEDARALTLTGHVKKVYSVFFGSNPEPLFLHYRLHQLLRALHATQYVEYAYALDPRITYVTEGRDPFEEYAFGFQLRASSGVTRLTGTGTLIPNTTTGRAEELWKLALGGSNTATLTQHPSNTGTSIPCAVSGGRTPLILLGTSGLRVLLEVTDPAAYAWFSASGRPVEDLTYLEDRLERIGASTERWLYGLAPVEPYATFTNLWESCKEMPDRLMGPLLALVYRLDELRDS